MHAVDILAQTSWHTRRALRPQRLRTPQPLRHRKSAACISGCVPLVSGGVVDIHKGVGNTEPGCYVGGHRRCPETLRRMVAAGNKCHAHFARIVRLWLGYLAGDEGVRTGCNRIFKIVLRATRAPCYVFYS